MITQWLRNWLGIKDAPATKQFTIEDLDRLVKKYIVEHGEQIVEWNVYHRTERLSKKIAEEVRRVFFSLTITKDDNGNTTVKMPKDSYYS